MLYSGNNNNYYIYYKKDDEEDNNIVQHIDPNETTITKEYLSQFKDNIEMIAIPSTLASIDNDAFTEMTELKAVIIDPDRDAKQESYDNRGIVKIMALNTSITQTTHSHMVKRVRASQWSPGVRVLRIWVWVRGVRHTLIVHSVYPMVMI